MKVVQVVACPYPTTQGTQVYVRGLVRAMAARGHEVHVVAYSFGEEGVEDDAGTLHRAGGVPGYRKLRAGPAWSKPLLDALLTRKLLEVVREVRPALIQAHNYEAPLAAYAVRRLTGVPVLYHSHNLMEDELHLYVGGRFAQDVAARAARFLDATVPRAADRVVCISDAARVAHIGLGVPPDRAHFLPPAIHPEDFPEEPAIPDGPPTVVYLGNPDAYQDLPILFAAFASVVRQLPSARLRLVSSADLGPTVAQAARQGIAIDAVTETSWPRVRALAREATVAAVPRTVCRGFPVKLLNGMALGLPTVACRTGGPLIEDGVTGRVVDDGDVDAFAAALLDLLTDPEGAHRMGGEARASALTEHTWASRAPALEAIWAAVEG